MPGALEGVRVLDCTQIIAGPLAGSDHLTAAISESLIGLDQFIGNIPQDHPVNYLSAALKAFSVIVERSRLSGQGYEGLNSPIPLVAVKLAAFIEHQAIAQQQLMLRAGIDREISLPLISIRITEVDGLHIPFVVRSGEQFLDSLQGSIFLYRPREP